jgi:hypothetical protein
LAASGMLAFAGRNYSKLVQDRSTRKKRFSMRKKSRDEKKGVIIRWVLERWRARDFPNSSPLTIQVPLIGQNREVNHFELAVIPEALH